MNKPQNHLSQSSLETYGSIVIGIVIACVPMTPVLKLVLGFIFLGLLVDVIFRSQWTIAWRTRYKLGVSAVVAFSVALIGWWLLSRSAEADLGAITPPVLVSRAPIPPIEAYPVFPALGLNKKPQERSHDPPMAITNSVKGGVVVQSFNQQGGQTAGTINNNNFGPPPLVLTDIQQACMAGALSEFDGTKFSLFVNDATENSSDFANTLKWALVKKAHLELTQETGGSNYYAVGGAAPPGISLLYGEARLELAHAFGRSLLRCRIVESPIPATKDSANPDSFEITVSPSR